MVAEKLTCSQLRSNHKFSESLNFLSFFFFAATTTILIAFTQAKLFVQLF